MRKPRHALPITRRNAFGLVIVLGAAGAVGWQQLVTAPHFGGSSLRVRDAHAAAKAGAITLIDIRRPDEWQRTGIAAGARPIDMRREDFLAELAQAAGPDKSAPIALICARGVRSARLANRLSGSGYTQVIDVPEGMEGSAAGPGWITAGLPVLPYHEGGG